MPDHTLEQRIPVVNTEAALVALFEAALIARPWDITLSERYCKGAGLALIAWARSKGLRLDERHFVTAGGAYANVKAQLSDESTITVLGYRDLTDDEIAAITVVTREREAERIGYGGVRL